MLCPVIALSCQAQSVRLYFIEDVLRPIEGAGDVGAGQVLQVKLGGQRRQGQQGG